jgi:pimeloyl-ACP methyl ester carboxylesterase
MSLQTIVCKVRAILLRAGHLLAPVGGFRVREAQPVATGQEAPGWGEVCPRCRGMEVTVDVQGGQAYLSCLACGYRWALHVPVRRRGRGRLIAMLASMIILVLAAGGGVLAYGGLVKGNPMALLPWGHSPSSSSAPSVRTFEMPSPTKPAPLPEPGVRPIIFLPGITGSYLSNGSTEVWPNVQGIANTLSCSLSGASPIVSEQLSLFSSIALPADGVPPAGSTVGAANGVSDPEIGSEGGVFTSESGTTNCGFILNFLAGLAGQSLSATEYGYNQVTYNAESSGYVVAQSDSPQGLSVCAGDPRCLVPVGYDWRLSAEADAGAVLQVINQVLQVTGADRVDILAHSQGGLVAEAITKMPQSVGKIYRIVTLGTPYLGAPEALTELLEQTPCVDSGCYLSMEVVQSLIENYPGVMELLPSASYYAAYSSISPTYATVESMVAQSLADLSSPAVPQSMSLVDAAEEMHQADDDWAPLDPTVGLLRMIGYDAYDASPNCDGGSACDPHIYTAGSPGDTIVNAFTPGGSLASSPAMGDGDGTVPLYSANLYDPQNGFDDRGDGRDMYWCGLSHMGLAQDTGVWQSSLAYLDGQVSYATDVLGSGCPGGGEGSIAGLGLVGAPPSEPAGAVPPGSASATSCSPATAVKSPAQASVTIINSSATDTLDLYWEAPGCLSELYATIPPQMQLTQAAYIGDIWRLKDATTGAAIGTISTASPKMTVVAQ